jgi:hypothetical protein
VGVLWTSTLAQSEYSPVELEYIRTIKRLVEQKVVHYVWFGDAEWLHYFGKEKAFWAPYPLSIREKVEVERMIRHVSLFGPIHPRKNVLNQIAACKLSDVMVHINDADSKLLDFLNAFGIGYVRHGWMSEDEYFKTIASMQLGLQVSHEGIESFSYVLFDHLMMDIPCLTSVSWAPDELIVRPTDIMGIAGRIEGIERYENRQKGYYRDFAAEKAKTRTADFKEVFEMNTLKALDL